MLQQKMKKYFLKADATVHRVKMLLSPFPKLKYLPFECATLSTH